MHRRILPILPFNFRLLILFVCILFVIPLKALATPSAQALHTETHLGGGFWQYNYTLYNTSDPITDAGFAIYDFFLTIDPPIIPYGQASYPGGWDVIADFSSFYDWFSVSPGEPPIGADITPGSSLAGFGFVSDTQLGSLSFDVYLANPFDPTTPVLYSGVTSPAPTPIPLPPTLFLMGSGLSFLGALRARRSLLRIKIHAPLT